MPPSSNSNSAQASAAVGQLDSGLLGFLRTVDLAFQSNAKLKTGLETTAKAVETLHKGFESFTELLKLPMMETLAKLNEGIKSIVSGATGMGTSIARSIASIGAAPTAILATGAALTYLTGSSIPALSAVGLSIEETGKKMGGFAGTVTFAAGAVVTASSVFYAAGVAWKRTAEQILGPGLAVVAAGAAVLGAALTPLGHAIVANAIPALHTLGTMALMPLGAAAYAAASLISPLANMVLPHLSAGFSAVSIALGQAAEAAGRFASGAFTKLGELLQPVWDGMKAGYERAKPYLLAGVNYLKESLGKVGTALAATGGAIAAGVRAAFALDEIKNSIFRGFQAIVGGVAGTLKGLAEQGASLMRRPIQVLDTAISATMANIGRFVQFAQPGVMQQFDRAVHDLYATIGHALVPVLQTATNFFRSIGSALNGLNANGTRLIQALAGGTAALIAFAAAVEVVETVATGGVGPLIQLLGGIVAGGIAGAVTAAGGLDKVMKGFATTLGGVMNALGKVVVALEPIGDAVMGMVGEFGSMIAGAIGGVSEMLSSSGIFADLAEIGKSLFEVLRPVVQTLFQVQAAITGMELNFLKHALEIAGPAIIAFSQIVAKMANTVMGWVRALMSMFVEMPELTTPKGDLKNNTGAAATATRTSTVEDALKRARESAFSAGWGGGLKPEEKTANNTKALLEKAEEIRKLFESIPQKIADAIKSIPGLFSSGLGNGLGLGGVFSGGSKTTHDVTKDHNNSANIILGDNRGFYR